MRLYDFDLDEDDELLDGNPPEWHFEFSEKELTGLRQAFDQFSEKDREKDNKISFLELFERMEDHQLQESAIVENQRKLLYGMLRRVLMFREVHNDARIDFEQFVGLLKKAMNMRHTRKQLDLLFKIFDAKDTGHITGHHIHNVTEQLGMNMDREEVRSIVEKCSRSGSYITKAEFA